MHRHYGVAVALGLGGLLAAGHAGVVAQCNAGWVDVVGAVAVHVGLLSDKHLTNVR